MQKDCWEQSLLCRSPADGELKNLAAHRFFIFPPTVEPRTRAAEGRSYASMRPRHSHVLRIALPLGIGSFVRLTPSRMPTETKAGPKGRERDLARPPAGAGCPFEGPAEATEAMREPARAKAQAKMALGTFAETKVPRPPGRTPAYYAISIPCTC